MTGSDKLLDGSSRPASKSRGKSKTLTSTPLIRHSRKRERRTLDLKEEEGGMDTRGDLGENSG